MKVLVSNIGSTSFKFRLFDMADGEREIASGGADRIGHTGGKLKLVIGGETSASECDFADHGACIQTVLAELITAGALADAKDLDAVAFKAVMGGDCDPVVRVDEALLERMEYFVPVAPAHNPPYIAAMRMFGQVLGDTPFVAAFEPGFHRTIPSRRRYYAAPLEWAHKYGVKRYGFHGASHRYIATRMAEVMPEAVRVISCHLGGSSSTCAIRDGQSVATSMGLSPQTGLPQGSRVGDLDVYSLKLMMTQTVEALQLCAELPYFESDIVAVNCHHNYVAKEHHFGDNVWVTRKGAVRAGLDELGIIPGSMGARSFIVRGKGNPLSFNSCSHGAGRAMSRTAARKRFTVADHVAATAGIECRKDEGVIDETPAAYKDIDAVMAAQADLVDIVHTLRQVVCVKG